MSLPQFAHPPPLFLPPDQHSVTYLLSKSDVKVIQLEGYLCYAFPLLTLLVDLKLILLFHAVVLIGLFQGLSCHWLLVTQLFFVLVHGYTAFLFELRSLRTL